MPDSPTCPDCGAALPAGTPPGPCLGCLLRAAQEDSNRGGSTLDLITANVGTAPHMRLRDTDPDEEPGPVVRPPGGDFDPSLRYRIDGEIGRGGMGTVLRGRDPDLGRDVALKVLREELRGDPGLTRRFVEEAQIGGQLQHPGVVPVYELGTLADRRPFFAMKLVKGHTLARLLDDRSGPDDDRPRFLSIFEAVCQTVAYAHARGVIHRDLKPSNVMVGSFGEVQVMDWGLAKVLPQGEIAEGETVIATARSRGEGEEGDFSHPGSAMGTPAYMAPEQARGELGAIDERADVFALGSILCEVFTGQPAFTGGGAMEILRAASRGETAAALALLDACGADSELVAIARDCLAVEPEDRPRHAGAVAERVTAHLAGVQERLRAAERQRAVAEAKAIEERKRRKLQLGLAASVLALLTAGGLGATYYQQQRTARAAALERVSREALTLKAVAEQEPEKVERWEAVVAAWRQAEAALGPGSDPRAPTIVAAHLHEAQERAEAARHDQALLDALAEVRASIQDLGASGGAAGYARTFQESGIDPDVLTPADAGARLKSRPASVAVAVAAALDDWAMRRREDRPKDARWRRPLEAARVADPDPFRDQVRAALLGADASARETTLEKLASAPEATGLPPASAVLLARSLRDDKAAVALLRRAAGRHPDDVWVNYTLADRLGELSPAPREEQVRYYTAARALRPETSHELAHVLDQMGRTDEALSVFADLVARRPGDARHLACYGTSLKEHRRPGAADVLERAVAVGLEAVRLRPEDAQGHYNLGTALDGLGRLEEAAAAFRAGLRLRPDDPEAHWILGNLLRGLGRLEEAAAEYGTTTRLQPDHAKAHSNLGEALRVLGKPEEAIAVFRAAIRLRPEDAVAHNNLGNALKDLGRLEEATVEFRKAIRLRPDLPEAHYNLGNALKDLGRPEEAAAEYRTAIGLRPDAPDIHCNLGFALLMRGDYAAAVAAFRRGHELGSKQPGWRYPSAQWLRDAERMASLAGRLPAILSGRDAPRDNAERLVLAQMCYETKRHAAAARLLAEALAAEPGLGEDRQAQHRYNAACAASLAAAGQVKDEPPPDEEARAKLRAQALGWLRAELAASVKLLDTAPPQGRAAIAQTLQHWKTDSDLAGVRDASALAKLPEAERSGWQALWTEVEALLKRAQ